MVRQAAVAVARLLQVVAHGVLRRDALVRAVHDDAVVPRGRDGRLDAVPVGEAVVLRPGLGGQALAVAGDEEAVEVEVRVAPGVRPALEEHEGGVRRPSRSGTRPGGCSGRSGRAARPRGPARGTVSVVVDQAAPVDGRVAPQDLVAEPLGEGIARARGDAVEEVAAAQAL